MLSRAGLFVTTNWVVAHREELVDRWACNGVVSCRYCGRALRDDVPANHPAQLTWDHATPRCRGGKNRMSNLVPSCPRCQNHKSLLTFGEYMGIRGDDKARKTLIAKLNEQVYARVETRSRDELARLSILGRLGADNRPPRPETLERYGLRPA